MGRAFYFGYVVVATVIALRATALGQVQRVVYVDGSALPGGDGTSW